VFLFRRWAEPESKDLVGKRKGIVIARLTGSAVDPPQSDLNLKKVGSTSGRLEFGLVGFGFPQTPIIACRIMPPSSPRPTHFRPLRRGFVILLAAAACAVVRGDASPASDRACTMIYDFENPAALHLPPDGLVAADFEGKLYVKAVNLSYDHDPADLAPGSKTSLKVTSRYDYHHSPTTGITDAQLMFKMLDGKFAADGVRVWARFVSTGGAARRLVCKIGGDGLPTFVETLDVPPGGGWLDYSAGKLVATAWGQPGQPKTLMKDVPKARLAAYNWVDFSFEHKGTQPVIVLDDLQTYRVSSALK
jgi:hypothetical protein